VALIKVDAEPAEVGFDASRLARIDRHFRRYVDDGLLAGWTVAVSRRGRVAYLSHQGMRDLDAGLPVTDDTIWRIYSMTKPITSVAAMMLYEEGALELTDPVARFIPSFADVRVYSSGPALNPWTVPATEPVRIWHLLTHTSGLTYGFHHAHPVDEMYRLSGFDYLQSARRGPRHRMRPARRDPAAVPAGHRVELRGLDGRAGPGRRGRVGAAFDTFLAEQILGPLGMDETGWSVDDANLDRLATLYMRGQDGGLTANTALGEEVTRHRCCTPRGRVGVDGGGLPPLHPDAAARR
jgi:CubicO group peptidase (beta-lactamase class C family)